MAVSALAHDFVSNPADRFTRLKNAQAVRTQPHDCHTFPTSRFLLGGRRVIAATRRNERGEEGERQWRQTFSALGYDRVALS